MNIVFTMAGKYSRFKLFGAQVPKYLLPLGQGTILSNIIESINETNNKTSFHFIANRRDQLFHPIIISILKKYNIDVRKLIYIDDTTSQLETATYAEEIITMQDMADPICFANIDTVTMNRGLFFENLRTTPRDSALIDTFGGRSASYSYVREGKKNTVHEVVDGNIVSEFACSGLYGFGSFAQMRNKTAEVLKKDRSANFTSLYNSYIQSGEIISHVPSKEQRDTVVLGTPEEYVINIHKFS